MWIGVVFAAIAAVALAHHLLLTRLLEHRGPSSREAVREGGPLYNRAQLIAHKKVFVKQQEGGHSVRWLFVFFGLCGFKVQGKPEAKCA